MPQICHIIGYFNRIRPSRWVKSWEGPFLVTEGLTTFVQVVEMTVANESPPWDVISPPPRWSCSIKLHHSWIQVIFNWVDIIDMTSFFSYLLMKNCWGFNPDERPTFSLLGKQLEHFATRLTQNSIKFEYLPESTCWW